MFNFIWPMALIVISDVVYQICAKSVPGNASPFFTLTITYLVGAAATFVLHFLTGGSADLAEELKKLNWAPFILGIVIVGLEGGWLFAYKAGWQVGTAQIIKGAVLGTILVFVGILLYKETMTWNKIVGVLVCMAGLVFFNLK